ncbi:putative RNA recognition motif domain, nucleotide-binding alpha-beta plait domain superfamily [Helianthus annuus]|uniref:RNA recognition motif domain, nucleotide-binding alpha-beta plait domain superfamily n=1 Tax=Helianthus annuus TaxID=4232 RepID=A0A9K3IJN6_HELAN|nr:putative RNA recognition motif domain, nucleotide-binding alpha-beta plait domain superfamily [Helianthus annuus]KAJ0549366.1 putative RNA recognition motif domain, nucleotide-binding alpha-beta plait domain superfamily [Helianthus annuus]KAJ0555708.1 putative RNA recognition motif domain, nucleotide-binding alpha-beta plait domain superfamily [Helianthus annuus]KAJ0562319.1 putative RNA recognition motif domain, nucleotide-binding alpha-beta plait domain superfamily [Helianthus annuus]KAJ07
MMAAKVMKFFVANIPEGCRPWDLATLLKDYGDLSVTYISRKRNKDGLKFGFVSFRGVINWKEMENKMKGIKLGKNTLKINLARFAKENGPDENGGPPNGFGPVADRREGPSVLKNSFNCTRPGCSYSMAFNSEKPTNPVVEELMVNASVSAVGSRLHRSVLARTRYFKTLVSIKQLLVSAGNKEVDLQYVGGFNLLLVFSCNEAAADFLSRGEVWKVWFSHADVWIGQAIAYERVA